MTRFILICAMLSALGACHRTPDEQLIRNAITEMQQAVESGKPRDFMGHVSNDFTGKDGTVDRDGLMNILRVEVLRNERARVTLGPIDVQMQGDRAVVCVTATLTGSAGGLLPDRASVYAITSGWRREGSDWRCYNATWAE